MQSLTCVDIMAYGTTADVITVTDKTLAAITDMFPGKYKRIICLIPRMMFTTTPIQW